MFSIADLHTGAWGCAREAAPTLRRAALLLVALMLVFAWAAPAHAQDAFEGQYGSPTASGEAALASHAASPDAGGSAPGAPEAEGSSRDAAQGNVPAQGSAPAEGQSGSYGSSALTVLPATGGPALQLVALGVLALGATLLIAVRGRDGGHEA